ncbi:LacI family DNA-binding transcriptional regulator [Defluviitalea phaphyphila]|uniref:LacI family DNA-binding transcriptional regulator n=1 Tax=Defluviitalea phaphyphila TaxID=1473580 RepID=UPI00072FB352|nr:LacI family DNA-binding transcriptional regulator [Defluviitalea phaphyphila]
MGKKAPTISDIAKLANVSIATVSRVLNNTNYPVKKEVREKVLKIAKELNYKPNIFSKMLKGGMSREIGVIIPSITNPFYAQLISAVEKECINRDYVPIVCSSYNSSKLEKKHLDMLLQKQVAGMLISTINTSKTFLKSLSSYNMKFVLFDQNYEDLEYDSVSFDFYKSSYLAVEYLIKCGHKDIAFLTAPIDRKSRKMIYKGYKQALRDNGLRFNRKRVVISSIKDMEFQGEREYENGKKLVKMLLKSETLPDAIVAINDMTAIGIIKELMSNKIDVPNDISVIGFDNISIGEMINPSLTTMHQPAYKTGTLAAKMLLDRIEGKEIENNKIILQPTLIERNSVKKIHIKLRR